MYIQIVERIILIPTGNKMIDDKCPECGYIHDDVNQNLFCNECDKEFCVECENIFSCPVCGEIICDDCSVMCNTCFDCMCDNCYDIHECESWL